MIEPPSNLPRAQRGDKAQNLDRLFEALKIAPDEESAKYIENRIWAIWLASGSDTANLLMGRVKTAIDGKDVDLAIKLLNAIIEIKPDFIEAWNRRATLYYMKKDFGRALADIREVLAREPRHFGALAGLGIILQEFGDDKRALDAFRRALAIHPHLERIPDLVKKLTRQGRRPRDLSMSRRPPSSEGHAHRHLTSLTSMRSIRLLRRFRADERDPQHVGGAGRAERHAGDHDHALAGLGEAILEGEPAGALHHVVEIVRVLRHDRVHAPDQRQSAAGREVGRDRHDRRFRPLARDPQARSSRSWSSR